MTGAERSPIAADLQRRLVRQLAFLNRAAQPSDMNLPGFRLHELKGDRKGIRSVTISGNWRLTFSFRDGDAYNIDLEDHH
jgi:proteic killer suppression protein